jgi:cyclohexadieny/prephenate dehydrogenase
MWRDIFLNNKEAVLEMISRFTEDLSALQKSIRWEDGKSLHKLFSKTRKVRDKIISAGQDTVDADFGRSKKR